MARLLMFILILIALAAFLWVCKKMFSSNNTNPTKNESDTNGS